MELLQEFKKIVLVSFLIGGIIAIRQAVEHFTGI
jgi:hypothetical protein